MTLFCFLQATVILAAVRADNRKCMAERHGIAKWNNGGFQKVL